MQPAVATSPSGFPLSRLARSAFGSALYAASAFVGAGTLAWTRGWAYAALFVAVSVAGSLIVHRANPELLAARARGIRADTKPFDRLFYALFLPLVLPLPLLAGLDAERFGWLPLPGWTVAPGVGLFLIGSAITTWTMVANAHAESTVRIQHDRGHAVVSDGPYRIVRHPMYLGTLIGLPGAALILGSGWALLPTLLIIGLFVWRTAREDGALRHDLAGYAEYARRTRYRLLPGVW